MTIYRGVGGSGDSATGEDVFGDNSSITSLNGISGAIQTPTYIKFDPNANHTANQGELTWNTAEGTLDLGLNHGGVVLQIGQELHYRVTNQSGSNIPDGTLVAFVGTTGNSGKLLIDVYDGTQSSKAILGLTTETIINGENGYVTSFGKVRGIQTNGANYGETWLDGDILYPSPTGLTKVLPQAPAAKQPVAVVVNAHNSNGELFVRVQSGTTLGEDELVQLTSLTNGDVLQYDSTDGRFENRSLSAAGILATSAIGTTVQAYDSNLTSFVNTFTLPTTDGSNGFVLTTNGAGTLSLTAPEGIPDGDKGDITVSASGATWTIDSGVIDNANVNASAAIESSKLQFTPLGTGATARTVQAKLREAISVKDFGAVGDGVTDDTLEIQLAVDSFAGNSGVVDFPSESFVISNVVLPSNVSLRFNNTTLIQTGSSTNIIQATGSVSAAVALTANVTMGDSILPLTSTSGISADDYLIIYDNYSYAPTDSSYKSGEMVRVKTVDSGSQVTLYDPLYGSMFTGKVYSTVNAASVVKITPTYGNSISGNVTVIGDPASTTNIYYNQYGFDFSVEGLVINGGGASGVLLRHCHRAKIINNVFNDLLDDISGGHPGYGVAVYGASWDVEVSGNTFNNVRHGFTTGAGDKGYPHAITVQNNVAISCFTGIDTHAAGDNILISGNISTTNRSSGISCRSINTRIIGNTITKTTGSGISLVETNISDITIAENIINYAGVHGISSSPSCVNLVITDNKINYCGFDGITLFGSGTYNSEGLVIANNNILGAGLLAAGRSGIITTGSVGSTGALIIGNRISVVSAINYAIRTLQLTGSWISDNKVLGAVTTNSFDLGSNNFTRNERVDSVNYLQFGSTLTGNAAEIRAAGVDSVIDISIIPKGSGSRIRYGTHVGTSDVPITGYIEIKDSGGTARKLAVIA